MLIPGENRIPFGPAGRRLVRLAAIAAALALAGCVNVVGATPDEVRIDTRWLGKLAPGTRIWLSWTRANEHCAAHGKKPEIVDLRDRIAIYRCVDQQ